MFRINPHPPKMSLKKYLIKTLKNILIMMKDPSKDLHISQGIKGWTYLGEGSNRIVFRRKNSKWVLKIPLNPAGMNDNDAEDHYYRKWKHKSDKMARCRLVQLMDVPCLIMEYVNTEVGPLKNLPEWTLFVDCQQVGYNSHGKLVAYDYARGPI